MLKKFLFVVSMGWMHNFHDKDSTLNFLTSANRELVSISLLYIQFSSMVNQL